MKRLCLVLLMAVLLTGCAAQADLPDIKSVVQTVNDSVALVTVGYSDGSGACGTAFFVAPNLLATAAHVVNPIPETINVALTDGKSYSIDPQDAVMDVEADVALMTVEATGTALPFAQKGVEMGDWIVLSGYPGGRANPLTALAIASNVYEKFTEAGAISFPGMSGGIVTNQLGEIVGMIVGASPIKDFEGGPGMFLPLAKLKQAIEKLTK